MSNGEVGLTTQTPALRASSVSVKIVTTRPGRKSKAKREKGGGEEGKTGGRRKEGKEGGGEEGKATMHIIKNVSQIVKPVF